MAGWACLVHQTNTQRTPRCCRWFRRQQPGDKNHQNTRKKSICESRQWHWFVLVDFHVTSKVLWNASYVFPFLPLIPGCCICSRSHRSPAVGNSLHQPGKRNTAMNKGGRSHGPDVSFKEEIKLWCVFVFQKNEVATQKDVRWRERRKADVFTTCFCFRGFTQ